MRAWAELACVQVLARSSGLIITNRMEFSAVEAGMSAGNRARILTRAMCAEIVLLYAMFSARN